MNKKEKIHQKAVIAGVYLQSSVFYKEKTLINRLDPGSTSGMTTKTKAFTLIELLVVVLFIGILAAIALPQYQKAVVKTKLATMLPLLKTIAQADSVFYMANGNYSPSIYNLDIDMPAECTATADGVSGGGQVWKCGNDILIDNSGGYYARGFYCPGHNDRYNNCKSYSDYFNITIEVREDQILPPTCYAPESSNLGQKICASFGF